EEPGTLPYCAGLEAGRSGVDGPSLLVAYHRVSEDGCLAVAWRGGRWTSLTAFEARSRREPRVDPWTFWPVRTGKTSSHVCGGQRGGIGSSSSHRTSSSAWSIEGSRRWTSARCSRMGRASGQTWTRGDG